VNRRSAAGRHGLRIALLPRPPPEPRAEAALGHEQPHGQRLRPGAQGDAEALRAFVATGLAVWARCGRPIAPSAAFDLSIRRIERGAGQVQSSDLQPCGGREERRRGHELSPPHHSVHRQAPLVSELECARPVPDDAVVLGNDQGGDRPSGFKLLRLAAEESLQERPGRECPVRPGTGLHAGRSRRDPKALRPLPYLWPFDPNRGPATAEPVLRGACFAN
jgi:hypothetical protein